MTKAEEPKPTIRFKRREPIDDIKNDLLGFDKLVPQFVEELRATDPPYVIGLTGEWGIGKSSFLVECIKQRAKRYPTLEVVDRMELWRFSGRVDLATAMVETITEHLRLSQKESAKELLGKVRDTLFKFASWVSIGLPGVNVHSKPDEIYNIWKAAEKELHEQFDELVEKGLEGKSKNTKIVVPVDDLDRCLPDKALEFLEKLRLFFDSERVIFIVALDKEVVADAITARFGKDVNINGHWYLEKLIDRMYRIPLPTHEHFQGFVTKKYKELVGIEADKDFEKAIGRWWDRSKGYGPKAMGNPRRILRAVEKILSLVSRIESPDRKREIFVMFPLLLLREIYHDFYSFVKRDGEIILRLGTVEKLNLQIDEIVKKHGENVKSFCLDEDIIDICRQVKRGLLSVAKNDWRKGKGIIESSAHFFDDNVT
ncbi:hypothetical protein CEE36_07685 [candidate division TA06 bacterium B3_TA06]|uniref:KAP NTPase domain-containing protein n=1 Tax=candidate division TA06 bacterium B3_TA06 TaxID=2012487 RepID=A0A532V453_UNCT6|nr:MAG: hypothetical protein CEE36_07685 [candidate division TA06 bacterium B3_TA06]